MTCFIHPLSDWTPNPLGYDPYNSLTKSYAMPRRLQAHFKAGMEKDLFSAEYVALVANTNQAAGGIGG